MKRKFNEVSISINNKKQKKIENQDTKPLWVSATHIRNYMIKDTLIDWLQLKNRRGTRNNPIYTINNGGFENFIMKKGIEFENKLIEHINTKITPVKKVSEKFTEEGCKKTKELMLEGIPVLHSAPVKHNKTNTGGIIDLLVRSDYIKKIINECPLSDEEQKIKAPGLKGNYHYIVIDIKFCTLPLKTDGKLILNSGNFPFYKAQCWIYTRAISEIQNYTSRYSFILGRRWKYTNKCIKYKNYNCLDKLGCIDFEDSDKKYIDITDKAVSWVRDVKENGENWSVYPPSKIELYPNMCVDSGLWMKEKEIISERIGEITSIWNCGEKNRNIAIQNGIKSWKDINCKSKNIGINGKRAHIIDKIIEINRQEKIKLLPKKIKNNMFNWKKTSNEMFVDFETTSDIFENFENLPKQESSSIIFMIGIGWYKQNKWHYKNFICEKLDYDNEYKIMNEFVLFLKKNRWPKLYFWHAENSFWNRAENRQFEIAHKNNDNEKKDNISDNWNGILWADFSKLFKTEPIVIKDCYNYSLKSIASAMRKNKLISAKIESKCDSGMTAMVKAWECYKNDKDPINSNTMKDIEQYNCFDVKVLWEILTYLRKKHK